jgi:hypothetical protein
MAPAWIDRIKSVDGGTFTVDCRDTGVRIGEIDASFPPRCVVHTTDTRVMPLIANRGIPHITVGPLDLGGRPVIRQLLPIGWMSTALQTRGGGLDVNRGVLCQVEQVAVALRERWLPTLEMAVQVASIARWLEEEMGIPRHYPYDPGDMQTGTWATPSNSWRRSGLFETLPGWHPHAAVPGSHQWDCGGEDFPAIFGERAPATVRLLSAAQLESH